MKRVIILTAVSFILLGTAASFTQTIPRQALESITPEDMFRHTAYLASDALKGRDTPSPELDSAAAYIAREFKSYELKPVNSEGSYYQEFNTLRTRLSEPNTLVMTIQDRKEVFTLRDDFIPLQLTANQSVENLPVVFAGYGITAPEYEYDDYAGIDVSGKAVLIFKGEPQEKNPESRFDGEKATDYSKLHIKVETAAERGAAALLLMTSPGQLFRRPANFWPSLMRNAPADAVPLVREQKSGTGLAAVEIGKKCGEALFEESGITPKELFNKIDEYGVPHSFLIPGVTVSMETQLEAEKYPVKNVAGFLEGSDPVLKDEWVIIGAHYDHVGFVNDSVIYNGADDNASGTAGVLEIAQAFTLAGEKPKRSVLFIAFTGEEKGLFGSMHYTDYPLFPLENTVAMLNMDMISRNDTNHVYCIGTSSSETLKQLNEQANEHVGMTIEITEQWFRQSDHYPFYSASVPVIFYNTGDTPDLHQPTDEVKKIIPEKMAMIGKLVFSTAWKAANMDGRPDFIPFR